MSGFASGGTSGRSGSRPCGQSGTGGPAGDGAVQPISSEHGYELQTHGRPNSLHGGRPLDVDAVVPEQGAVDPAAVVVQVAVTCRVGAWPLTAAGRWGGLGDVNRGEEVRTCSTESEDAMDVSNHPQPMQKRSGVRDQGRTWSESRRRRELGRRRTKSPNVRRITLLPTRNTKWGSIPGPVP
jgi:hypothetical protein